MEQSPPACFSTPIKKGIPPLAWLGMGCGGLLIMVIMGGGLIFMRLSAKWDEVAKNPEKAAAEFFVKMNPNLDLISQDLAKGEMTIKTKNGESMTLSYRDIAAGRIAVKDAEGNTTRLGSTDLSRVPSWVPLPPEHMEGVLMYHTQSGGGSSGLLTAKSPVNVADLKTHYEDAADRLAMSNKSSSHIEAGGSAVHTMKFSGAGKSLEIIITGRSSQAAQVNISYKGR